MESSLLGLSINTAAVATSNIAVSSSLRFVPLLQSASNLVGNPADFCRAMWLNINP